MEWWAYPLEGVGGLAVVALLCLLGLFVRRRLLGRGGAAFECSLRTRVPTTSSAAAGARGWTLGLAKYDGSRVLWYRVFSFSFRPKHVFDQNLQVLDRRTPGGAEAFALYSGHDVVRVRLASDDVVELAMADGAITGFLAWSEAAPPGAGTPRA